MTYIFTQSMSLILNTGFKVLEPKTRESVLIQTTSLSGSAVKLFWLKSPVFKSIILMLLIQLHLHSVNCHINVELYDWMLLNALLKAVPVMALWQIKSGWQI